MADALDFYPDRAPEEAFRTRAWDFLQDPIALRHWLNHYFASAVHVAPRDEGGNKHLDCQFFYKVSARSTLNGLSYKEFFDPLFRDFGKEAQQTDFDIHQYPSVLLEVLGIRDIRVTLNILEESGAIELPDAIIGEIKRSSCKNALTFLKYLESMETQGQKPLQVTPVMDRRPELQVFKGMLGGDDPQHRLMRMVGDYGQGKTWLMRTFERMCLEQQVACHKIDLSDTVDLDDVLDGIWRKLGSHLFPSYSAQRERVGELDQRTPEERRRELTGCFFADWQTIGAESRLVVLFDTYEKASPILQDWIEKAFLEGLQHVKHVLVVIAGRQWPKLSNYWQEHGYSFPLEGVQLRDYKEYAEQRGQTLPESELVQVHQNFEGRPKLFVDYLNSRPQAGGQNG